MDGGTHRCAAAGSGDGQGEPCMRLSASLALHPMHAGHAAARALLGRPRRVAAPARLFKPAALAALCPPPRLRLLAGARFFLVQGCLPGLPACLASMLLVALSCRGARAGARAPAHSFSLPLPIDNGCRWPRSSCSPRSGISRKRWPPSRWCLPRRQRQRRQQQRRQAAEKERQGSSRRLASSCTRFAWSASLRALTKTAG